MVVVTRRTSCWRLTVAAKLRHAEPSAAAAGAVAVALLFAVSHGRRVVLEWSSIICRASVGQVSSSAGSRAVGDLLCGCQEPTLKHKLKNEQSQKEPKSDVCVQSTTDCNMKLRPTRKQR